ncbi:MAG: phosphodiester glycosidase family protein [Candidatus Saganbacteria bacterium]|nr:phosphodiester glycosidase family protein [Candidatus Saganbacteria bacterium]
MKTIYIIFIIAMCLFLLGGGVSFGQSGSVTYEHLTVRGFPVDVVKVDLKDPHITVTPVMSKQFPAAPESFEKMVAREDPVAAINGNFFCKRTYKPVGDVVINGELVHFGGLGTAMGITEDNNIEFITVEKYRHMNWGRYKTVISCGPKLLEEGRVIVDARAEGFKDPNLFTRRNRSAVGVTWDKNLLFVTINSGVLFEELAVVMKDLGCKDAMNLDGGSSSGLYYRGQTLTSPSGPLPDILVVQEREFAPNVLISMKEKMLQGEKRVEILSSVTMVMNKDKFLVKGAKDGKVFLIMRFESPNIFEAPQIGAKITATENKITVKFPIEKLIDAIKQDKTQ